MFVSTGQWNTVHLQEHLLSHKDEGRWENEKKPGTTQEIHRHQQAGQAQLSEKKLRKGKKKETD